MHLIKEQDLNKDLEKDHFMVLKNYAQLSETQILLNEFMLTKSSTVDKVRQMTDVTIHLHDVFDLHPRGAEHKKEIQEQLEYRKVDNVVFNSTSPLEVDQKKIEENGPYDLVYVNLPWSLPQSPNTVEMVVSETIKLWWWALQEDGVMIIPDYNKANIKRSTDAWIKAKDCNSEKYYNTNYDRPDLEEDHFMIALQKNG
jgi:hypothetical protein|tara:strand:- start:1475 stop:2071 length:597 start_codon:yes stop_codon:yes gene_type:complete